jgi:hypothetical protein
VNGELGAEDQIPAVLYLLNGIMALQIDHFSIGFRKLRPQYQRPVIEALAGDVRAQTIHGGLQARGSGHGEEDVGVLAEGVVRTMQLPPLCSIVVQSPWAGTA